MNAKRAEYDIAAALEAAAVRLEAVIPQQEQKLSEVHMRLRENQTSSFNFETSVIMSSGSAHAQQFQFLCDYTYIFCQSDLTESKGVAQLNAGPRPIWNHEHKQETTKDSEGIM